MKYRKWNIGEADRSAVDALRSAGYSGLLASVLAARGVTTPEAAAEKLERERKLTLSPLLMKDMDRAVARIQQAIADGETMAVFGDYDVDGITATVVVEDYLRRQGAECLRYIPRRVEDGYGLSGRRGPLSSSPWTAASPGWRRWTTPGPWAWTWW